MVSELSYPFWFAGKLIFVGSYWMFNSAVSDADKGTVSDICSAARRVVSAKGPPGRQSGGWRGLGSLRRIAERHEDVAQRGSETKVAPGPALPPTTIPYGRRGPIPRRGLYTLSATQEQERAENQRRLLKSTINHGTKDDAR